MSSNFQMSVTLKQYCQGCGQAAQCSWTMLYPASDIAKVYMKKIQDSLNKFRCPACGKKADSVSPEWVAVYESFT